MTDKLFPDKKFLEFWGNLLINAAKGQEQFEQLASLMRMPNMLNQDGIKRQGMEELFKQFYTVPSPHSTSKSGETSDSGKDSDFFSDALNMEEGCQNLMNAFEGYADMWGWVPKKTHETLLKEYKTIQKDFQTLNEENNSLKRSNETLKETNKNQETLISQLRQLLTDDGKGDLAFLQQFKNLAQKQSDDFQDFVTNISSMFQQEEHPDKDDSTS